MILKLFNPCILVGLVIQRFKLFFMGHLGGILPSVRFIFWVMIPLLVIFFVSIDCLYSLFDFLTLNNHVMLTLSLCSSKTLASLGKRKWSILFFFLKGFFLLNFYAIVVYLFHFFFFCIPI